MLSQWVKLWICAALLVGAGWPASSYADKQDYDLADRIYEKFKEREEKVRDEKQKRASGQQENSFSAEREERRDDRSEGRSRRSQEKSDSHDQRDQRDQRDRRYYRDTNDDNDTRQTERTRSTERRIFNNQVRSNRSSSPVRDEQVRERVSLDQAVNMIRRRTDGKVVGAKTTGSGARRQHRIKVLINDSRVRTYIVNATTGEIY